MKNPVRSVVIEDLGVLMHTLKTPKSDDIIRIMAIDDLVFEVSGAYLIRRPAK